MITIGFDWLLARAAARNTHTHTASETAQILLSRSLARTFEQNEQTRVVVVIQQLTDRHSGSPCALQLF